MRSRNVLALTTLSLAFAASAAQAGDIHVKPGRQSIRHALRRAKAGDRLVLHGAVRGDVTISVPDITIDGGAHGKFVGSVSVQAEGVTIRDTQFKNSQVLVAADDVTIVDNRLILTAVQVDGDGTVFGRNDVEARNGLDFAVTIQGDGTRVEDNMVSDFSGGVRVSGDETVVSGNSFDTGFSALTLVGSDVSVSENVVERSATALTVEGDRASVTRNDVSGQNSVQGNFASVTGNEMDGGWAAALTVSGADAVVTGNELTGSSGGALVDGDGATISDNVVTVPGYGDGAGIVSVGDGAVISGNDVMVDRPWVNGAPVPPDGNLDEAVRYELSISGNDGISAFGNGSLVADNEVQGSLGGGAAVRVQGDGNSVDSNEVHDVSQAYGIAMIGDENTATSNDVGEVEGEGVVVQGEDGLVADTSVHGISSCGFLLVGSTTLEGCTATTCNMGVVNLGDLSKIDGTTISGNAPYDLVDLGRAAIGGDSTVGWTIKNQAAFYDFMPLLRDGFVPAPTPKVTLNDAKFTLYLSTSNVTCE